MDELCTNMDHLLKKQFEVDYFSVFHNLPCEKDFDEYKDFLSDVSHISSQQIAVSYEDSHIPSLDWAVRVEEKYLRSLHWKHRLEGDHVGY